MKRVLRDMKQTGRPTIESRKNTNHSYSQVRKSEGAQRLNRTGIRACTLCFIFCSLACTLKEVGGFLRLGWLKWRLRN